MIDREKVIKGLESCASLHQCFFCESCEYPGVDCAIDDALELLKEQREVINELYTRYDGLCKEIREKYEGDDVCGLCQYDGAYVGESGDWMNECPGFETSECFCMKNSIRKMCGYPLIEEE